MRVNSSLSVKGRVVIEAWRGQQLVSRQVRPNLVTNSGLNLIRDVLGGLAPRPSHMATGSGTGATVPTDTQLKTERFRGLITKTSTSFGLLEFSLYVPSTEANGTVMREVGIFNAASGGTMLARATFADISKNSSISVIVTWALSLTAG